MKPISARMLSKRTQLVWVAFFFAIPCALFVLQAGSTTIEGSVLLTTLASVDERPESDPIFETVTSSSAWNSIVIHHLGQPAGDIETVDRDHRDAGLNGFGYHFLIGNGNGLADGAVQIGYRWINQTEGAKPANVPYQEWKSGIISICLIGNGNRRPFTDTQLLHLSHLVQRLQQELAIPASKISLASAIGDVSSPGKYFAEAQFRSQLLDIPSKN